MKKIFYFLIAAAVFASCSSDDEPSGNGGGTSVTVSTAQLSLESQVGKSTSFTVTSQTSWSISYDADWFSVSPTSGEAGQTEVTITVTKENDTSRDRYYTLQVGDKTVNITQKYNGSLTVTDRKEYVDHGGGYVDVEVKANVTPKIIIPVAYQGWISQEQSPVKALQASNYRFKVEAITGTYSGRTGIIVVVDENNSKLTDTVFVYQTQKNVILIEGRDKFVDYEDQEFNIELRHNVGSYTLKMPAEASEWLSDVTPVTSGTKSSELSTDYFRFKVEEYSDLDDNRTAKVVFVNEQLNTSDTLTVIQRVKEAIVLSPTTVQANCEDNILTVSLDANTDNITAKIVEGGTWILEREGPSIEPAGLIEVRNIKFRVIPNFMNWERYGKIDFYIGESSEVAASVKITQEANPAGTPVSGNRALIATYNSNSETGGQNKGQRKVLVSWRYLPTDPVNIAFDLWRSESGGEAVKLNAEPIDKGTNFQDETANRSADNTYYLRIAGTTDNIGQFTFTSEMASRINTLYIPLNNSSVPDPSLTYTVQDAQVEAFGSDGSQIIVVRRDVNPRDIGAHSSWTGLGFQNGSCILQGYKLDGQTLEGTYLWTVDLGININQGEHTTPFVVFDFDGDGFSEIAVRTSEGTTFGDGVTITNSGGSVTDYRTASNGRVNSGPEYLSIINGQTGAEMARTDYIERGDIDSWGSAGDSGNRAHRFLMGVGYFDGVTPSVVMCRGYYAKSIIEAWDFRGGTLTNRWKFQAIPGGVNSAYAGRGNHSIAIGDVDSDGFDEIVYGGMVVESDGTGKYTNSNMPHGDALHFGKFDPDRKGLQIWSCFESGPWAGAFRDAATGEVFWYREGSGDVGRAMTANYSPAHRGNLFWTSSEDYAMFDVKNRDTGIKAPTAGGQTSSLHAIWWTGSLNRQVFDKGAIVSGVSGEGRVFTTGYQNVTGFSSTNKNGLPFFGDFLGDWREELLYAYNPGSGPEALVVITTDWPCNYRFPHLMTNRHYRLGLAHQNVGYNQPPHLDYYIGPDMFD